MMVICIFIAEVSHHIASQSPNHVVRARSGMQLEQASSQPTEVGTRNVWSSGFKCFKELSWPLTQPKKVREWCSKVKRVAAPGASTEKQRQQMLNMVRRTEV
jgi:hypothetical protein